MPVDLGELRLCEVESLERAHVRLELLDAARADERRSHPGAAKRPGERELSQRLPTTASDLVQGSHLREGLVGQLARRERAVLRVRARALRNPVEVAVGQDPLGEWREADAADSLGLERVQEL